MKPLSPELRERLGKLLPRLASPFGGERLATLEAIERVLSAEGCDLHDLTHAVTTSTNGTAAGKGKPRHATPPSSECEIDCDELQEIVEYIQRANERWQFLNERSSAFLDSLRDRCDR